MPRSGVLGGLAVIAAAFIAAFGIGSALNGSAAAGMPPRATPIEVDEAVIAADVATGAELPPLSADVAPPVSQPRPTPTPAPTPRPKPAATPDPTPEPTPDPSILEACVDECVEDEGAEDDEAEAAVLPSEMDG
jgi:hypothetical protein